MTITDGRVRGTAATVLGLAAATVATWWLWLGRDTTYQVDPVTGVASGPYEAWQVIGCVLCLAALAVAAGLIIQPWLVVPAMAVPFTAAWSVAASGDESGLWPVGAMLILIGMTGGSAVLSTSAWLLRRHLGTRHPAPRP